MSDFQFIPIPPRDLPRIEPAGQPVGTPIQPDKAPQGPDFKDSLRQALGNMTQQAEEVSQAPAPSYEEMQKAMDAATHAFQDTMQAHFLMQKLIQDIQPASQPQENQGE